MNQRSENPCLQAALRLLTYRDHSCAELAAKLRCRGFSTGQIDRSMEACIRLDYLNDERFTLSYIRQLRRKGFGPKRIQEKLRAKGIDYDMVQKTLISAISQPGQTEDCRQVLVKKMNRSTLSSKTGPSKVKLYRFLLGLGFYPEIIQRVLKENSSLDHTASKESSQDLIQR